VDAFHALGLFAVSPICAPFNYMEQDACDTKEASSHDNAGLMLFFKLLNGLLTGLVSLLLLPITLPLTAITMALAVVGAVILALWSPLVFAAAAITDAMKPDMELSSPA
jgi:hypothetical protein